MMTVLTCLERDHNPWLVALAAALCLIGCHASISILRRAHEAARRRQRNGARAWTFGAAIAFGSTVWTTHFVGMLAYVPADGGNVAIGLTLLSLAVAIAGAGVSFTLLLSQPTGSRRRSSLAAVLAGCLLGATIFAMHGLGVLTVPGLIAFAPGLRAASLLAGTVAAAIALTQFARRPALCAVLLVVAVCSLHFIGMAAMSIAPFGERTASGHTGLLAIAVAAVCLLIVLPGLAGAIFDQHLARRSRREARRLQLFTESAFEGILFHRGGRITDTNAAFSTMSAGGAGGKPSALLGQPVLALFVPASQASLARALAQSDGRAIAAHLACADGTECPVEVRSRLINDDVGARIGVMVVRDLREQQAATQRIERLAHYDTRTGVANRLLFGDRLLEATENARLADGAAALLWINLDRFKAANDLFGHSVGDGLLAQVAQRLIGAARGSDTVARVGGDEFAIVLPTAGRSEACALATRLLAGIVEPFDVDGHSISIGCSIGISLFPDDGDAPETLMRNAGLALSRAKQDGRGAARCFEPAMDERRRERLSMEDDLREALANGEMQMHYQPKFNASDLRLEGYEALIRWRHPVRGAVSPATFIPLAEATGIIVALGRWVLETSCAEAARWPERQVVAVNLSPIQLRQVDLVDMVAGVLRRTGLDASRLELEITEGVLIADPENALSILQGLKGLGVQIALDDYGTGYSSLHYLSRFAFDRIKVDASYIRDLGKAKNAEVIIDSIVALGHGLHMAVTAEGVETETQLALLRRLGCDQIQGYLLGRPMPSAELLGRMACRPPVQRLGGAAA